MIGDRDKRGRFKKGMKAWNFKHGKKLKRKFKRFNGKLILNSHFVWLKHNKLTKVPKGYVIHHKDGDSLNDKIENLILMEDIEHRKLHNRKAGHVLIHSSPKSTISEKGDRIVDTVSEVKKVGSFTPSSGIHSHHKVLTKASEESIHTTPSGGTSDKGCAKCKNVDWIKSEIHLKPIEFITDKTNLEENK